ncbi:Oxygen sensor histidine kinase NreB [compost metagenome]
MIIDFKAELFAARYSNEIETVVYRICQEAILNGLKYANTDEIQVRLFEEEGELQLIVQDDGAGFQTNLREPKGTGLGLFGMRERSELVHGELNIASEVGKGTTIHLRIPLSPLSERGMLNENCDR